MSRDPQWPMAVTSFAVGVSLMGLVASVLDERAATVRRDHDVAVTSISSQVQRCFKAEREVQVTPKHSPTE